MKRIAFLMVTASLLAQPVAAGTPKVATVYYPKAECAEIVSQEYSTGGGNASLHMLEILCRNDEGSYVGFVASWSSISNVFGLGRFTAVDKFIYKPSQEMALRVVIH